MLKAFYQFSQAAIPVNQISFIDLQLQFKPVDTVQHKRRPLNLSIVIDRSGSMAGKPLKQALNAACLLVEHLTEEDMLSIVAYDDEVDTLLEPQNVTDKEKICDAIRQIYAVGWTNLSGGWLRGCDHVQANYSPDKINRVLLLTDGQANVGITDNQVLINTAQQKALVNHIHTTTLGFGSQFNEDLLIGIVKNGNGNFYYIQTPEDLAEVFKIELDSLRSLIAQDLIVTLVPQNNVQIEQILNDYRQKESAVVLALGDVYAVEDKTLSLAVSIPTTNCLGKLPVLAVQYRYQSIINDCITQLTDECLVEIQVDTPEIVSQQPFLQQVLEQSNRLRIAKVKEEAIALADQGHYQEAAQKLQKMVIFLHKMLQETLKETFELSEDIEQLHFFSKQLSENAYNVELRKELKDQSYQSIHRNRTDLSLRGISVSNAICALPMVHSAEGGIILECVQESGKLRMKIISQGYQQHFNVQFPRAIREAGAQYLVDAVILSESGTFYRTVGDIRLLVTPERQKYYHGRVHSTKPRKPPKAATAPATAADLETTDTVGSGVLVHCVKEGSKLRVRVVSDGYDHSYNIRFPRSIRELGVLYVVDELISNGSSYIACGKIKRFIQ